MRNDEDDEDEKIFQQGRQPVPSRGQKTKPVANTRRKQDPFVKVPLWWAAAAANATRTPRFLVCIGLLRRAYEESSCTFSIPSGWLKKNGASRKVKSGVLRDLKAAGLITIEQRPGKNPLVTLVLL